MHELRVERLSPGNLDAVRWVALPSHADDRGVLTAVESGLDIPFEIRRVYIVHHVHADRAGHAHRATHQVVVAAHGSCEIELFDGSETRTFHLDDPTRGLLLGPMLFIRMTHVTPDAAIVVMASTHYDKKMSLRSLDEYLEAIAE